jgi:enamine deaminase RidA (YjgF/YER057c/UK114 family)
MNIAEKLKKLNITLPPPPAKGGLYTQVKIFGHAKKLVQVAGCGSGTGKGAILGRVGKEVSALQANEAARRAMLNMLADLEEYVPGGLERIKDCLKIITYVQCVPEFYDTPAVANGGIELLANIFGEEDGIPTRCAIGVASLPYNQAVLSEGMFELK